jgi:hypothetical protein
VCAVGPGAGASGNYTLPTKVPGARIGKQDKKRARTGTGPSHVGVLCFLSYHTFFFFGSIEVSNSPPTTSASPHPSYLIMNLGHDLREILLGGRSLQGWVEGLREKSRSPTACPRVSKCPTPGFPPPPI